MSEKQFDKFDERFKEAAEQFESPFEEASWQKLEAKLNEPAPKRPRRGGWWEADALMIGLLLYIAVQLMPSHKNDNTANDGKPVTLSETVKQQQSNASPGVVSQNGTTTVISDQATTSKQGIINQKNNVASPSSVSSPIYDAASGTTKNRSSRAGSVSGFTSNQPLQNRYSPSRHTPGQQMINQGQSNKGSLVMNDGLGYDKDRSLLQENSFSPINAGKDVTPLPEAAAITSGKLAIGAEMSIEKVDSADLAKSSLKEEAPPPSVVDKANNITKTAINSGFYIYGVGGSEWSKVSGNPVGPATFAWGVGLGYRFSPKWAIQAGYFSTRKLYDAGPGDYKPKPGTYYYNLRIKHVEADCNITEIPVSISYTLLNKQRHSLLSTLGFSSVIMNSEEYHYDYIRANQMPGYSKYRYETHNSHLFAGLMLSAGYSFRFSDDFSISAEPYYKIPLYGVGEGSIKINSFGLMAGARYNLPSFRRR